MDLQHKYVQSPKEKCLSEEDKDTGVRLESLDFPRDLGLSRHHSGYEAEAGKGNPWMDDLDALSFKKDAFSPSPTRSHDPPSNPNEVITFEEVPPVYPTSPVPQQHDPSTFRAPEPDERSFEVITYESPADAKPIETHIDLSNFKLEGVEVREQEPPSNPSLDVPLWPEKTIEMPPVRPPSLEKSLSEPLDLHFTSLPLTTTASKPAYHSAHFQDFEEELGDVRQWQVCSAQPGKREDGNREVEDEFSLNLKAEVAIRAGGEKQYTSHLPPLIFPNSAENLPKRKPRIDPLIRQKITESRLEETVSQAQFSEFSPELAASTPLKIHNKPSLIFEENEGMERRNEEQPRKESWNNHSAALSVVDFQEQVEQSRIVTYTDVWPQFEQMDISEYVEREAPFRPPKVSLFTRCFGCGPPDIEIGELREKCRRILVLIQVEFNDSQLHWSMLLSVWKLLTGRKHDCMRLGTHWGEIGFQGTDPATDFRGMGVFGLIQMLYFASTFNEEAKVILARGQQMSNSFPFAIQSLSMSKIVIEALREQSLNAFINRWRNVFDTVQFFYIGTFMYWFQQYERRHLTISDVGALNLEVLKVAKHTPSRMFDIVKQLYRQKGVFV